MLDMLITCEKTHAPLMLESAMDLASWLTCCTGWGASCPWPSACPELVYVASKISVTTWTMQWCQPSDHLGLPTGLIDVHLLMGIELFLQHLLDQCPGLPQCGITVLDWQTRTLDHQYVLASFLFIQLYLFDSVAVAFSSSCFLHMLHQLTWGSCLAQSFLIGQFSKQWTISWLVWMLEVKPSAESTEDLLFDLSVLLLLIICYRLFFFMLCIALDSLFSNQYGPPSIAMRAFWLLLNLLKWLGKLSSSFCFILMNGFRVVVTVDTLCFDLL